MCTTCISHLCNLHQSSVQLASVICATDANAHMTLCIELYLPTSLSPYMHVNHLHLHVTMCAFFFLASKHNVQKNVHIYATQQKVCIKFAPKNYFECLCICAHQYIPAYYHQSCIKKGTEICVHANLHIFRFAFLWQGLCFFFFWPRWMTECVPLCQVAYFCGVAYFCNLAHFCEFA